MKDGPGIAGIAALIGDHARADMLTALLSGEALTASELAHGAGVTKQTASAHLAKMLDAGLLAVESQGRHRYFRLADRDVAKLLETIMGVAYRVGATRVRSSPREPALRMARVCYDHLAGDMGVLVLDSLEKRRFLRRTAAGPQLTASGRRFCATMDIDLEALAGERRDLCRLCLDWSVRRHHLAGSLGSALLAKCFERGWAKRVKGTRIVQFTPAGERAFRGRFPVASAD
jgi:DNA-binding transcriptional ArsR family regulator